MSDDAEVQVAFHAQITSLLDGMGKAQNAVKEATEGMSGSIAKMAETMATLGPAALALAAVGLAFEGIKKAVEYVEEATEKTKELAETFRTLSYATGASNQELNQYTAAMEMSGGSVDNVTGLMQGMVRAVKANGDGLVLNGMAADKAGLQQMSFGDYLKKASEIADQMRTPLERDEFLTLAFGRAGAKAGAQLHEMVENMEKVANTTILNPGVEATMKALTESEGNLKRAQEARAASVAAMAAPAEIAWNNIKAAALDSLTRQNVAMELANKGLIEMKSHYDEQSRQIIYDWDSMTAAAKKYGEEAAKNAKLGAEDSKRELMHAGGGKAYVDPKDHQGSESTKAAERAAKAEVEIQEACNESLGREKVEMQKWLAAQDKQAADEAAALDKSSMEQAERNAMVLAENLKAQDKAVLAVKEANIAAYTAKQAEALKEQEKANDKFVKEMTKGWADAFVLMANGQLTFGQFFKGAVMEMGQTLEKTLANMAAQWLENQAKALAISAETHMQQNYLAAKTAAGEAWSSAAAIPYVGWIMAPVAAAAAFTGVMAFAEQGYDVPYGVNPLTQLHQQEMVLPAQYANVIRDIGNGSGGGSGDHFHAHFHGVTDASWWDHNQGNIMRTVGKAMRNGRKS